MALSKEKLIYTGGGVLFIETFFGSMILTSKNPGPSKLYILLNAEGITRVSVHRRIKLPLPEQEDLVAGQSQRCWLKTKEGLIRPFRTEQKCVSDV